jgi:hypothetical protein
LFFNSISAALYAGEINSKNRGIITGEKKGHKIIIHFAVPTTIPLAAHEFKCRGGALLARLFK